MLLLTSFVQNDTVMAELRRFTGSRWFTAIQMQGHTEHVISKYVLEKDGSITAKGIAESFESAPMDVVTRMIPGRTRVGVTTTVGGNPEQAYVTREGDELVFNTIDRAARVVMVERLKFESNDLAKGTVFGKDGKEIAQVTMKRVIKHTPELALEGRDPVALIAGRDATGKPEYQATNGQWNYRFSTAANLTAFLANKDANSLQFDGACMNMGPLTGRGQPSLFGIHEGKIYTFASPGCKRTVEAAWDRYVDKLQPKPAGTKSQLEEGRKMLDAIAAAHGKVDSMKTLYWAVKSDYQEAGKTKSQWHSWAFDDRGNLGDSQGWDSSNYRTIVNGRSSWSGSVAMPVPLHKDELAFFKTQFARHPLYVLKHRKSATVFAIDATHVRVHLHGATTDIEIDLGSNKIKAMRYYGRTSRGYKDVTQTYDEWAEVAGVIAPKKWTNAYDDRKSTTEVTVTQVNAWVSEATFANPLQ